jgi:hypothetical protein
MRRLVITAGFAVALFLLSAPAAWADGCALDNTLPDCAFNGGLFLTNTLQPAGTGFIDSFLRVQMKGTEQGFNTDNRQSVTNPSGQSAGTCDTFDCNSKTDQASYTRDIQLGDVRIVNGYYEFLLDVNEQAAIPKNFISLDQLELFAVHASDCAPQAPGSTSCSPLTGDSIQHVTGGANTNGGSLTGLTNTKVYDLDWGGTPATSADNWVNIDYNLSGSGSGKFDMTFYVPTSYFAGYSADSYVYLYSEFGCVNVNKDPMDCNPAGQALKYKSGAGFEEWTYINTQGGGNTGGSSPVPEPGTFALIGTGLAWVARRRRRGASVPKVL